MYNRLTVQDLLRLIECLLRAHEQARHCNNNSLKRAIFWKAAFKGRCKPNLQKLESHSIHVALNILFHLYADVKLDDQTAAKFGHQLQMYVLGI